MKINNKTTNKHSHLSSIMNYDIWPRIGHWTLPQREKEHEDITKDEMKQTEWSSEWFCNNKSFEV